jgi:glycosyltransferase involved in cell wall biosynthesis
LQILGQGSPESWISRLQNYNLIDQIKFCGTLPGGKPVMDWLDKIDLYIQPSFHEGLPRAVIEAMSRGCPALASNTGGIPELLPSSCIHEKGNWKRLATQVLNLVENLDEQKKLAHLNFKTAQNYTKTVLTPRREEFWKKFKSLCESQVSTA